jgi:hypothetical protein
MGIDHDKFFLQAAALWDGKTPLAIEDSDHFFWDSDDFWSFTDEMTEEEVSKVKLVDCVPQFAPILDPDEWLYDVLPEDGESPDVIVEAAKVFNDAAKAAGPISWLPSGRRIDPWSVIDRVEFQKQSVR